MIPNSLMVFHLYKAFLRVLGFLSCFEFFGERQISSRLWANNSNKFLSPPFSICLFVIALATFFIRGICILFPYHGEFILMLKKIVESDSWVVFITSCEHTKHDKVKCVWFYMEDWGHIIETYEMSLWNDKLTNLSHYACLSAHRTSAFNLCPLPTWILNMINSKLHYALFAFWLYFKFCFNLFEILCILHEKCGSLILQSINYSRLQASFAHWLTFQIFMSEIIQKMVRKILEFSFIIKTLVLVL